MRLAAGLRPDPLGELERSPRPPSRKKGATSKGRGREGREGEGWERRGGKRRGEGRGRKGGREGIHPYHEILDPPLNDCVHKLDPIDLGYVWILERFDPVYERDLFVCRIQDCSELRDVDVVT